MRDILGEDWKYFDKILEVCQDNAQFYNFSRIETPILEQSELFSKGIGLSTDIVEKEMYAFKTKGGDELALRPEGTAPVVRAYIEHGMSSFPKPIGLWYLGPFFRHESPQAGRFREFWQFGFESLGEKAPIVDAQIIQIFYNILKSLKIKKPMVEINSIGDAKCRPRFKRSLLDYLENYRSALCPDCKKRFRNNPLRVLDCKKEKCREITSGAPQFVDGLCRECHQHFMEVLEFLDALEIPYRLNPCLVRGLDYYTKTVFEFFEDEKADALTGGGRYDDLVKLLGGKDTPACGAAAGIERIVEIMKERSVRLVQGPERQVFLAQLGALAKKKALVLVEELKKAKIPVLETLSKDALKSQLKRAHWLGVKYTLILGQKEALDREIILRDMKTGKQETIKLDKIVPELKKKLRK